MEEFFKPDGWFIQSVIIISGILGNVFVAHKKVVGFYFWGVTNLALIYTSLEMGLKGQAGLYWFYTLMLVYSVAKWKREDKQC